ncbi:MAG: YqeG family HAD IIIA-type phosphatase [Clostridia bacterium]|nr:YqeG family HAD IIIA-type phosphatase [Clostridia bacterium]
MAPCLIKPIIGKGDHDFKQRLELMQDLADTGRDSTSCHWRNNARFAMKQESVLANGPGGPLIHFLSEKLKPDRIFRSIEQIDFRSLKAQGIRLVLLDIDNTLVHHGSHLPDAYARRVVESIQNAGLVPFIVSNAKPSRARSFAAGLGIDCIGMANKPSASGLLRACHQAGIEPSAAVMIGDQLFTDILAAKKAGVLAILVLPLDSREVWNVAFKRWFEAPFLRQYTKDPTLWPQP